MQTARVAFVYGCSTRVFFDDRRWCSGRSRFNRLQNNRFYWVSKTKHSSDRSFWSWITCGTRFQSTRMDLFTLIGWEDIGLQCQAATTTKLSFSLIVTSLFFRIGCLEDLSKILQYVTRWILNLAQKAISCAFYRMLGTGLIILNEWIMLLTNWNSVLECWFRSGDQFARVISGSPL